MEIESVRALKAQLAETMVRPLIESAGAEARLGWSTRSLRRSTGVQAGIALGIAKGRTRRDYRLAVRVQRRGLDADPAMAARIAEVARQEADIRYVGRLTKRDVVPAATNVWHQARQRPLLLGASIGHVAVTAGTLGAIVRHRKSLKPVVLSNNHVLANEDRARIGDIVVQPGIYDGGRLAVDAAGRLLDFVALKSVHNLVDAAVATLDGELSFDPLELRGLGRLAGLRQTPVEPGDRVAKVGRTTGVTHGVVTAIEVDDIVVGYERGNLSFDRQIEIEGVGDHAFSAGGDSGSLIVDSDMRACGLLFAGGDAGGSNGKGLTFANELSAAFEALNIDMAL